MSQFLESFRSHDTFAWTKINHGFWEALGDVEQHLGWPVPPDAYARADEIATRRSFFVGGFVDELLDLIAHRPGDDGLTLAFELSAWPGDNRIIGTPYRPDRSRPVLERYRRFASPDADGLLLKRAVGDGSFSALVAELRDHRVVVVGPEYLGGFCEFAGIAHGVHLPIHHAHARETRHQIEDEIVAAVERCGGRAVVLLQAGTLAPYWILRLRPRLPGVRWIDGGLALSISHPEDILRRPWGRAHRAGIVRLYNSMTDGDPLPERARIGTIEELAIAERDRSPHDATVQFVADKAPDHQRVAELLSIPRSVNRWANGGPLVRTLQKAYHEFLGVPGDQAVVACANGGIALEALGRLHDIKAGRRLRWGVSAFTFMNQARGYFADARCIDCDESGMLSIDGLDRCIAGGEIDGFVVTNIFGLWRDFTAYAALAEDHGVAMVIDNAAGIATGVPECDYQAFSLHHTKPYGFGEGGLALLPEPERKAFEELVTYGPLTVEATQWLNNGKLSEVAAAYHLDRLERAPEWAPLWGMQGTRITHLALRAGLTPLFAWEAGSVATSMPFAAPTPIDAALLANEHLTLGKYYTPLAATPVATGIYARLVNVPSHADVAGLSEEVMLSLLGRLTP